MDPETGSQATLRGTIREDAGILEAIHALQENEGEDLAVVRRVPAGLLVVGVINGEALLEKVLGGVLAELAGLTARELMIAWPASFDEEGPLGRTLRRVEHDLHHAANALPL